VETSALDGTGVDAMVEHLIALMKKDNTIENFTEEKRNGRFSLNAVNHAP
jgi:hypothetical protein